MKKFGKIPSHLALSIAALMAFYQGTEFEGDALVGSRNGEKYLIKDNREYLETFASLCGSEYKCNGCKAKAMTQDILSREDWWGMDLTSIDGLQDVVEKDLRIILDEGIEKAIRSLED